jgi:hypothetical protein
MSYIDAGTGCERHHRPNARNSHEAAAYRILPLAITSTIASSFAKVCRPSS